MFLEKLHIYGWSEQEPAIMAGLLSGRPLLLTGETGTAKTEAVRRLAKSLNLRFHRYDASKSVFEDVIGFPNPQSLSNGKLDYVETPLTLWDKQFILIDEINRAPLQMQNKWFEIINEATLMGRKTSLIYRVAAMNPSSTQYIGTSELDLALRDRFALYIGVPSTSDMRDPVLLKILENGDKETEFNLKETIDEISATKVEAENKEKFLLELSRVLRWEHRKLVSGRRLVLMNEVLTQALKLEELYDSSVKQVMRYTMFDIKPATMDSILDLVLSKSPLARKTVKMLGSSPAQKLRTILDDDEDTRARAASLGRLLSILNDMPKERRYVYMRLLSTIKISAIRDVVWSRFEIPEDIDKNKVKDEASKLETELKEDESS